MYVDVSASKLKNEMEAQDLTKDPGRHEINHAMGTKEFYPRSQ